MIAKMKGFIGWEAGGWMHTGGRRMRALAWRSKWVQLGGLVLLWLACEWLVSVLGVPLPGGVLGLAVLLALLASGRLSQAWVRRGASGLLDNMVLFFVPAMLAVVDRPELFSMTGLKLLGVVMVGTLVVMAGTAGVVEWSLRRRMRQGAE